MSFQRNSVTASKSNMFARNPAVNVPRSLYRRPFGHTTTFNSGFLVPIFCDEILPGDTVACKVSAVARIATLLHPIMDNLTLQMHAFFVPNRLVWSNWQKFMGEQDNPTDSIDFVIPQTLVSPQVDDIFDHFGLSPLNDTTNGSSYSVSALPFRAYNLIWNEWFRNENLQDSVATNVDQQTDTASDYKMLPRSKRKDYFTSALPFPQKGPSVAVSLAGTAPVHSADNAFPTFNVPLSNGMTTPAQGMSVINTQSSSGVFGAFEDYGVGFDTNSSNVVYWADPQLYVDLSLSSPLNIEDLRQGFMLQQFLERDARGGTRYTELLRAHFGVISPDARLQRPEYLGAVSSPINIQATQQTSFGTTGTSPQGNLAANGTLQMSNQFLFHKSFVEHGHILVLMSIRSYPKYQQGVSRMWLRQTRYDFAFPDFAHLGEQSILNKEIYVVGENSNDAVGSGQNYDVFGYAERYADYRAPYQFISGYFRSSSPDSLDSWTLAENFTDLPVLSDAFIQDNPPIDRVVADSDNVSAQFLFSGMFDCVYIRPLPTYSLPAGLSGGRF
nr:MAG: major capsid protein [Microvirus sp.]